MSILQQNHCLFGLKITIINCTVTIEARLFLLLNQPLKFLLQWTILSSGVLSTQACAEFT